MAGIARRHLDAFPKDEFHTMSAIQSGRKSGNRFDNDQVPVLGLRQGPRSCQLKQACLIGQNRVVFGFGRCNYIICIQFQDALGVKPVKRMQQTLFQCVFGLGFWGCPAI